MAVLRAAQRDGARHGSSAGIGDVSLLSSVSPAGTSGDSPPGCRRHQIAFLSHCTLDRGLLGLRPSRAALPPLSPSRWGLVLGCETGFSRGGRDSSVCKAEKFPHISVNRRDRHQIKLTPRAFKVFFSCDGSRGICSAIAQHPQHGAGQAGEMSLPISVGSWPPAL